MMKTIKYFSVAIFLIAFNNIYSQGSCASPLNLGTPSSTASCQTLSTAVTGSSPCAGQGYGGNSGGIIYTQFCTNSSADCVNFTLTDGTTSGNWAVTVYQTGCTSVVDAGCLGNSGSGSSFNTSDYGLAPNTCYTARIWVANPGSFDLCVETLTPSYDACAGAQPVDGTPSAEDNFCTTPGPTTNTPTITPPDLCAGSLENTAWYSFTVLVDGDVVITFDNITCTGGAAGFQIGFFTGSCGTLSSAGCTSGSGGTVTATISGLTAGEEVYMAVDGNAGANCTYNLSATNTVVVLPVELLEFSGNLYNGVNEIWWTTASEKNNDYFILEHSTDGKEWKEIQKINGAGNSSTENTYGTTHRNFKNVVNYYRLKQVDFDGTVNTHKIISINNTDGRVLLKKVNSMGQEVNDSYKGMVIEYYEDGSTRKVMQ